MSFLCNFRLSITHSIALISEFNFFEKKTLITLMTSLCTSNCNSFQFHCAVQLFIHLIFCSFYFSVYLLCLSFTMEFYRTTAFYEHNKLIGNGIFNENQNNKYINMYKYIYIVFINSVIAVLCACSLSLFELTKKKLMWNQFGGLYACKIQT